jgi:hypothetical protein
MAKKRDGNYYKNSQWKKQQGVIFEPVTEVNFLWQEWLQHALIT